MKLTEINLIVPHKNKRFVLADFDLEHSVKFGYSEGGTVIIKATMFKDNSVIIYALYDKTQQNFLTSIIGRNYMRNNVKYFLVEDAFTPIDKRRQGYASALYVSLVSKYHIKLMSGGDHTKYGRRLWLGISKRIDVKVIDITTDQIFSKDQISNNDIYILHPEKYRLIAERAPNYGIPPFPVDILEDYNIYTHSKNTGLYE